MERFWPQIRIKIGFRNFSGDKGEKNDFDKTSGGGA